jgi:hypothetical protein
MSSNKRRCPTAANEDSDQQQQQRRRIRVQQSSPVRGAPILKLPSDVLRHMCTFLPPLQGPCALARVNRDWCRTVKTLPAVAALHALYTLDSVQSDAVIAAHTNRRLCAVATDALAQVKDVVPSWLEGHHDFSQDLIERYMNLMESIEVHSITHEGIVAGNAVLRVKNSRAFFLEWASTTETGWGGRLYIQRSFTLSTSAKQLMVRIEDTRAGDNDDAASFDMDEWTEWLEHRNILLPTDSIRVRSVFQYSMLDDLFASVVQEEFEWSSLVDEHQEDEYEDDEDEDDENE